MMGLRNKKGFIPNILILLLVVMMAVPMTATAVFAEQPTVNLGTASSFGILAGSTITNTGPTTVSGTAGGNIGLHPGTSFTGETDVSVTGYVYVNDAVAEQAKVDLVTAYNDAAGRTTDETISADLGGRTLTPGVYTSADIIGITGMLTLDGEGDPNAVFVFQAGSTLTTASDSEIKLINGAQPCRIFWQVGSSATLGTGSYFVGHILALTSITAKTGAEVQGQLLARNGAVTLDTNTITNDVCTSTGLRVTKAVQGPVNDMTLPYFEITLAGPNEFSDTQTIESGNSYTWVGLVSGTYTVSEGELIEQWNASGTGEYDVQTGELIEVTITNTYVSDEDDNDDGTTTTTTTTGTTGGTPATSDETAEIPDAELPGDTPSVTPIDMQTDTPEDTQVVLSPELDIPADSSPVLPQTGDSNPWAFYLIGFLLVAGGVVSRKKMHV